MSECLERIEKVVGRLREAVAAMPDGPGVSGAYFAQWPKIGRFRINCWITDVEQALRWATEGIREAERSGPSASRNLEEALWRLDAADDRLVVVLSLALGVGLIDISKNRAGVTFRPKRQRLLAKLTELATASALALDSTMRTWYEHPARTLRHQVTHSLSQTTETQPLLDLDVRYRRGSRESNREAKMLYPDDLHLGTNDIRPAAVWSRVVGLAGQGLELMVEYIDNAATVISTHARLEPPTTVYYDLESGRASLEP